MVVWSFAFEGEIVGALQIVDWREVFAFLQNVLQTLLHY